MSTLLPTVKTDVFKDDKKSSLYNPVDVIAQFFKDRV